jgi:hypothetical protein
VVVEPYRAKASSSASLRVTSLNPVRDAMTVGHDIGMTSAEFEKKNAALIHRFVRLLADGESGAIATAARGRRVKQLLEQLKWACDGITDDIVVLEKGTGDKDLRDRLMRESVEELSTMAELSTGNAFTWMSWRDALAALRGHVEKLVARDSHDAIVLADIDLGLERIERIEKTANSATRLYLGYVNA